MAVGLRDSEPSEEEVEADDAVGIRSISWLGLP